MALQESNPLFCLFSINCSWKASFLNNNVMLVWDIFYHDLITTHTCKWCLQDEKWIDPPSHFREKFQPLEGFLFAPLKPKKSMFANIGTKIIHTAISAYRKPAFQPSAFRQLFIGFQPSAEKKLIYTRVNILDLKILQVVFKNRGGNLVF